MKRTITDGNIERGTYTDISSRLVCESRAATSFEPIELWFDDSIAEAIAISHETRIANVDAARSDEASWRRYMDFAFGQQGMPRDMAKFADPQDKFLARYMIGEFEKGIPHTQTEQQLRAVRFEEYWKLLKFPLPRERQQELDDAMHVAGQEMELFGRNVQNQVGGVAMNETATLSPNDAFVPSSHLRVN